MVELPAAFDRFYRHVMERRGIPINEGEYRRLVSPIARDYYAGRISGAEVEDTVDYVAGEMERYTTPPEGSPRMEDDLPMRAGRR